MGTTQVIKTWPLTGGIHPAENKSQSNKEPIRFAGIPKELVFPLSQHIGAPAKPVVAVGDKVLKGQLIGEAQGFVSVPVHASTSGVVTAIEQRPISHPSGLTAPCIVVESDGFDTWIEHEGFDNYQSVDKAELLTFLRNAGIAGMGGAGFPTSVKLHTGDKDIETLIINGTECEPYITADDMLMRERSKQLVAGIQVLQYLIGPSKSTLIGIEDNKPEAIKALKKATEGTNIDIAVFPTKYPSGGEKQLIQILTGKEVPKGKLPADIGIVCQNVGTTIAIYRAIKYGEPLIQRVTTITGDACESNCNYDVLIGTPIRYLLELNGFNPKKNERLIKGGPMMGYTINNIDSPVVKSSNCILAPSKKELPIPPIAQACIRCGLCAEACPASLLPQQLYWYSRAKDIEQLEEHNIFDCIECGACSYSCPSNIPLVQYYRASKADIRQHKADQVKAEHAKQRFEARQERLEKEAAEKEAKRKARQEAAKAKAAKAAEAKTVATETAEADPAQAAIAKAMAKRASGETEKPSLEKLQQDLASAEKRLASATEKLAKAKEAGADTIPAFEKAVSKSQEKRDKAEQALKAFKPEDADETKAKESTEQTAAIDPNDPVQKALLKRQALASMSPQDKLASTVKSLEERIAKAQTKLAKAEAEGDDTASVLATSIEKLSTKLDDAKKELAQMQTPAASEEIDDPVKKALQKREALAAMTPEEKLANTVKSLEERIEKTRSKLAKAEANGDDTADILASTLEKLETKLTDAKQELAQIKSS